MPVNVKMHKFQLDNTHLITRNKKYDIGEEMKIYLNDTRGEHSSEFCSTNCSAAPPRALVHNINYVSIYLSRSLKFTGV